MPNDHTPAPWHTLPSPHTDEPALYCGEPDLCLAVFCETDPDGEESKANAARVVACVNACEGIDDPAATLAEVRVLLEDLADMDDPTDTDEAFARRWRARAQAALALLGGK